MSQTDSFSWTMSFEEKDLIELEGFDHPHKTTTMPFAAVRNGVARPLGTCFAISNHGLALTARHVVEEAVEFDKLTGEYQIRAGLDWEFVALYISQEPSDQGGNLGGFLPVRRVWMNNSLDLALLHLNLPTNRVTKEALKLPSLQLSPGVPEIGQFCVGLGYPEMKWRNIEPGRVDISTTPLCASRGKIEEVYFPRRDSTLLPFPCFRTSASFPKGMSGGPVFSESGQVCGVIASGFDVDTAGGDISHVSLVGPALGMHLEGRNEDGSERRAHLYEFVDRGSVSVDSTYSEISVRETEAELIIDFGQSRRCRVRS